eukprot:scaffold34075_cov32-Tisochrysis_lutea.AAC.1
MQEYSSGGGNEGAYAHQSWLFDCATTFIPISRQASFIQYLSRRAGLIWFERAGSNACCSRSAVASPPSDPHRTPASCALGMACAAHSRSCPTGGACISRTRRTASASAAQRSQRALAVGSLHRAMQSTPRCRAAARTAAVSAPSSCAPASTYTRTRRAGAAGACAAKTRRRRGIGSITAAATPRRRSKLNRSICQIFANLGMFLNIRTSGRLSSHLVLHQVIIRSWSATGDG